MKCNNCGFDCNENATFCEKCGNKLEIDEIICSACSNNCNPSALFCEKCGNSLEKEMSHTVVEALEKAPEGQNSLQTNKASKNKKKKVVTITGTILCSLLVLVAAFCFVILALAISDLYYPQTMILPLIMLALFIIAGVVGIVACLKYNKKIFILAVSLFLIGLVLYPTSKIVNQSILRSEGAPKNEAEELIKEYKDKCIIVPFDDLKEKPEKNQDKHVKYVGQVVQVIANSDSYSEYLINITKTHRGYDDTVYVAFPHYPDKSVELSENDIVLFYGYSDGLYNYENSSGNSLTFPKITARYLESQLVYEELLVAMDETYLPITYNDLMNFGNNSLSEDTAIRITGRIVEGDYLENYVFFLIETSESYEEEWIAAVYIGNEYIEIDDTVEYTFYGTPMDNSDYDEVSEFSIPLMVVHRIG